ncbi:hypothetical protein Syun_006754 [Stephania yunnanensis]|uniref:Uncharacterized protein n=1 Tax=Stephania yunnanensis TaxID=152371 RepID=A0AAP0KYM8_9MAGN
MAFSKGESEPSTGADTGATASGGARNEATPQSCRPMVSPRVVAESWRSWRSWRGDAEVTDLAEVADHGGRSDQGGRGSARTGSGCGGAGGGWRGPAQSRRQRRGLVMTRVVADRWRVGRGRRRWKRDVGSWSSTVTTVRAVAASGRRRDRTVRASGDRRMGWRLRRASTERGRAEYAAAAAAFGSRIRFGGRRRAA